MNIAHRVAERAKLHPFKKSVVFSQRLSSGKYEYPYYTFQEFEERSNQMSHAFQEMGITVGTRTLLFVKPCLDFSVITFALFKIGAIPVLIDPGMGMKNLLASIKQVKPQAMVSVGAVHWVRRIFRNSFNDVKIKVSLSKVGGKTHYLYEKLHTYSTSYTPVQRESSDHAAILFTSGGTGIPKGVQYTHGILNAQTDALQGMFSLNENHSDLPGFPLFALFTLAMGMTSVIPDMDPTRPAQCDPKKLVQNILDHQISFVAGSPAIWERVGRYCLKHRIQLGSVRQVVMFGAPVRGEIHQMFQKILPFGDTYTPYGATECLPVSLVSGSEVLNKFQALTLQGQGTCIGQAVAQTQIKIIKTSDIPESELDCLPAGTVGEIVVCGQQVTPFYFDMPDETARAKILVQGKLWHRMGDMGYLDQEQNLWFLGRKSHRVTTSEKTFYPIEIEAIFNQHPVIKRSALIKLKKNKHTTAALVIERWDRQTLLDSDFLAELKTLANTHESTRVIEDFFLHAHFPVDVRHNIKIDRLKLSAWAQQKVDKNGKTNRASGPAN